MTISAPKETPEEMEKRIRAKIKADQPDDILPPPLDPSAGNRGKKAEGGMMGGMKQYAPIVIISFIISFLVVTFLATTPFNTQLKAVNATANSALSSANAASDNTKKAQASVDSANTSISAVQASLQAANADTASKITALNGQITALQSSIGTLNGQISSLQGSISAINNQLKDYVTTEQLSTQVSTQVVTLTTTIKTLQDKLTADEATITALTTRLAAAEASIAILQKQTNLAYITVNTSDTDYSITNNTSILIALSVTNSGNIDQTVPLTLTLTLKNSGSVTGSPTASMDRANTVSVSGTTITFHISIFVGANETVSPKQSVTIVYTGTSPIWTAAWSK